MLFNIFNISKKTTRFNELPVDILILIANYSDVFYNLTAVNKRTNRAILYEDSSPLNHVVNFVKLPKDLAPKFPNGYIRSHLLAGFIDCHPTFKTIHVRGTLWALKHNIDTIGNRKIIFTNIGSYSDDIDQITELLHYPNIYFRNMVLYNVYSIYMVYSNRFTNTQIEFYRVYGNKQFSENDYSITKLSISPPHRYDHRPVNFKPLAKCMNLKHINIFLSTDFSNNKTDHHDLSPLTQLRSIKIHNTADIKTPSVKLPENCHHLELHNAELMPYRKDINIIIKNREVVRYLTYKNLDNAEVDINYFPNLEKVTIL